MNLSLPWCTYRTTFSNQLHYTGKGKTANVLNGTYTGSGTRYKLALLYYKDSLESGEITKVTTVLSTHATEDEAYAEEERIVPIESLMDPLSLNMHAGGTRGKYKTPGMMLRQINAAKRKSAREAKALRAKVKRTAQAEKIKELKKELKNK